MSTQHYRSLSFALRFNSAVPVWSRELYSPATIDSAEVFTDYKYSGFIDQLQVIGVVRNNHQFSIWLDWEGEETLLTNKISLTRSTPPKDLLPIISATGIFKISEGFRLGIQLHTPDNLIEGDVITFLGFVREEGVLITPTEQAPTIEEPIPLVLQGGWTFTGDSPYLRKYGDYVEIVGQVSHPGTPGYQGNVIVLPSGYRPPEQIIYYGGIESNPPKLSIETSGEIKYWFGATSFPINFIFKT
ncbi:hypothetical protein [Coleofasciculus sp. G2-EDA-02]|uniref:hypothetical protein n=1 Tax=Coleofasciculus sp. G2-EDA-02 TaxID=3069529 RepID=UPI0032F89010